MDKESVMRFGKSVIGWLFIAVSVLLIGRSLALCLSDDIWYDELFTVGMIEHSYGEIVELIARDVHPPLYFWITKSFVYLCKLIVPLTNTVFIVKLASVLPYFILFFYCVTFIRKKFGIFVGGMLLFCVVSMPRLSEYMVEARMYSWALLFVTAALIHAYSTLTAEDAIHKHLHGAAMVFFGLAAAYTQYFACVAVIVVYFYVLVEFIRHDRPRIKEWILWVVLSVAGYFPWLSSLFTQITTVRENYWIQPLTWRSLGGCVKFLLKPSFADDTANVVLAVVFFALYIVLFCGFCMKVYYNGREVEKNVEIDRKFSFACVCLCSLCGLVAFGFLASALLRPIFVYRYMISAAGGFWFCFVLCLDMTLCKPKNRNRIRNVERSVYSIGDRIVVFLKNLLAVAVIALAVVVGLQNFRAFAGEEKYKKLNMYDTRTGALENIGKKDIVIYNFDQVQAVTSYYLDREVESYLWNGMPEQLIQEIIRPYGTVENTDTIKEFCKGSHNVWFIGSFNSRDEIVKEWQEDGIMAEEIGSYLLERYWFNLYKISIAE